MAGIHDYSTIAASNGLVGGVNIAENCPAGNLNDGMRAIMADLASFVQAPVLDGNSSVSGTINVSGAATLAAALSVGGTLGVTGAATFGAGLTVTGAGIAVTGAGSVTGNMTVGGALGVTGAGTVNGTLGIGGDTSITGNLLFSQAVPTITFNPGGPRIISTSGNRLGIFKDGTTSEKLAIASDGTTHVYGDQTTFGTGGSIPGSGSLRVAKSGAGYAISTWDFFDYTAIQFVRQVSGVDQQVGAITCTSTTTSYGTTSDERLKRNFRDFDADAILDAIWVGAFDFTDGSERHGVRAQQAWMHFPEAIIPGSDETPWAADYSKFVPLLMRSRAAMKMRIEALEARLTQIETASTEARDA